MAAKLITLTQ